MAPVKDAFVQIVANAIKYCLNKFGGHGTLKQCCAKCRCLGLTKSVGESQGKDVPYLAESLLFVFNTLSS